MHRQFVVCDKLGGKLLRLVGGGAVADGEQIHIVLFYPAQHIPGSFLFGPFALGDLDDAVVEDAPGLVHHGAFAAVAVAGVKSQHRMPGEGGLQQELLQVHAEELDGLGLSFFGQAGAQFPLQGRQQQALIAVRDGLMELPVPGGAAIHLGQGLTLAALYIRLVVGDEGDFQHFLFLPPIDGQYPVGGQGAHGLGVIRIHLEGLGFLRVGLGVKLCLQEGRAEKMLPHLLAQGGFLRHLLRHDIPCSCQGILGGGHFLAFLRADVFGSFCHDIWAAHAQQHSLGQGLQALFPRHHGPGALLLLIGQVEVFQLLQLHRLFDGLPQLIRELALGFDGGKDFLLPLYQIAQGGQAGGEGTQGLIVQPPGGLLAVARDKGHGVALVQQGDGGFHLIGLEFQFSRQGGRDILCQHIYSSFLVCRIAKVIVDYNAITQLLPTAKTGTMDLHDFVLRNTGQLRIMNL